MSTVFKIGVGVLVGFATGLGGRSLVERLRNLRELADGISQDGPPEAVVEVGPCES